MPIAGEFSASADGWDVFAIKKPTEERKFLRMISVAIRFDGYAPLLYRISHLKIAAAFLRSRGAPLRGSVTPETGQRVHHPLADLVGNAVNIILAR